MKLGNTTASKPIGRDCPCVPVRLRPPRPIMRLCVDGARSAEMAKPRAKRVGELSGCPLGSEANNSRPGGLKNRCAQRRVSVRLTRFDRGLAPHLLVRRSASLHAPAAPIYFGEWWSGYTRVSETRGRKPMQVRILSRRPISAPRPLSSSGDPPLKRAMRVQVPSRRPIFRRVVQSEPSAL